MFSKTSIILSLCFWLAFASAAVNLAQIVASNENLEEQATNADTDVNDLTALNGLDYAPKATQDLAGINSALSDLVTNAGQVTPTGDGGDESSVTSSFASFSNALTKLMNDLISKEEMLAMFDQKTMVYGNLTFLEDNYNNYSLALQNITMDQADKESVDDATGGALGQIGSAVSAYA
ncbi:hypothetical protein HO133_001834 [Letharia lupina]|uniref:Uncharacterized protein n=1 Tax=Letharia lupina TaxID=560253 RepID=A0A8H6CEP0_9LECA|nr:uncharacterized protein HO133_001834 [Letharia lupina]KAF6221866.1 hypothetical protein HO133_001834 [Letharia lupina]